MEENSYLLKKDAGITKGNAELSRCNSQDANTERRTEMLDFLALAVQAIEEEYENDFLNLTIRQRRGAHEVCIIWDFEPKSAFPVCANVVNDDPRWFLDTTPYDVQKLLDFYSHYCIVSSGQTISSERASTVFEIFNTKTGETIGYVDDYFAAISVSSRLLFDGVPADYINADTEDSGWTDYRFAF